LRMSRWAGRSAHGSCRRPNLTRSAKKTFPQFIFRARHGRKIAENIRFLYSCFSVNWRDSRAIFLVSAFCLLHSAFSSDSAYTMERQVRYSFTLSNSGNTPLERAELWVNVPLEKTATQWCLDVNASEAGEMTTNSFGNRSLHFKVALPPYGERVINIAADLKLASEPQPMTGKLEARNSKFETDPKSPPPADQPAAEIITSLASRLKRSTSMETARSIYRWVADNLKNTGYHKTDRGALWALENKQGDCTEFAGLFAALCRADGIPARVLSGFTCPKNMILKPYSLHNWAEFYDGKVWRLADPLERNFDANQAMYIAFAVLDDCEPRTVNNELESNVGAALAACPSAFFSYSGPGLVVKMNK